MRCERCARFICGGGCLAWVDGNAYTLRELVLLWGIQARQVLKHLKDGTKPRCSDGSIVRQISDGRILRPCTRRGGRQIHLFIQGKPTLLASVGEAARVLGVPRASLHRIVHDPRRVIPDDWKCVALRTDRGFRYKALRPPGRPPDLKPAI